MRRLPSSRRALPPESILCGCIRHKAPRTTLHTGVSKSCREPCKKILSTTIAALSFEGSKSAAAVEAQELHELLGHVLMPVLVLHWDSGGCTVGCTKELNL